MNYLSQILPGSQFRIWVSRWGCTGCPVRSRSCHSPGSPPWLAWPGWWTSRWSPLVSSSSAPCTRLSCSSPLSWNRTCPQEAGLSTKLSETTWQNMSHIMSSPGQWHPRFFAYFTQSYKKIAKPKRQKGKRERQKLKKDRIYIQNQKNVWKFIVSFIVRVWKRCAGISRLEFMTYLHQA